MYLKMDELEQIIINI